MLVANGYMERLATEVEALAEEWLAFCARATTAEIEAAKKAISAISKRGSSDEIRDHDIHNLIANWTIKHVRQPVAGTTVKIDVDGLWKAIEAVLDDIIFHHGVDRAGTIYGFNKYEQLDPGWLQYIIGWLRHAPSFHNDCPPGQDGVCVSIADEVKIAVVGDWGTGTCYPTQTAGLVADAMQQAAPDFSIHLGDVYYAGKPEQQVQNFLDPWAKHGACGSKGSFTLNSNHDMYSGARGYVETTLKNPMFVLQKRQGHFVLENKHWVVVGLDTAWPANWDEQYMFGDLDECQLAFLIKYASKGKKLILLTHHQGLMEGSGKPNDPLHSKVLDAIEKAKYGDVPWYWYWGHIHAGYVHTDGAAPYRGRCAGHGAIPWGMARELEKLKAEPDPKVAWFEKEKNPIGRHQVMNGFAMLKLNGLRLTEQFIAQDSTVSWHASHGPDRAM